MVRGRIGGDGRPFNLGEGTVTRATVRLASGETGFAYHLGRDASKAIIDVAVKGGEAAIENAHRGPRAEPSKP